ncbi:glycosyltransferase family 2 protein [Bacteroides sedimenti]|uniref:Glycosyltransferase 2-like domain-containing protein n=1 Tax=Bacteroides sedimenti TaxID=2136147 RepID=A0ABM8IEM5_9BACE
MPVYISVVLCTYNDEKYIAESIQSILDQTYPYFEFIIIDDGSTDETNKIIKSFVDSRIILIEKANTGLIDSLNIGFARAKYDWVARMDGDDISLPERLETQVKYIKNSVAVIGSQCALINENGDTIGHTWFKSKHRDIIHFMKIGLPVLAHPSVLINKKMFDLSNGYDKLMYVAEDFDLWCKLSHYGELMNINKELLCLRKHSSNISSLKQDSQFLNTKIALFKLKHRLIGISQSEYNCIKNNVESSFIYKRVYNYRNINDVRNIPLRKMLRIVSFVYNIIYYFFL